MKKRAIRRDQEIRKKNKAKRIMKENWGFSKDMITERSVGLTASTHGKPCSCPMCGNPRKYWNEKTRQEVLEDISDSEYPPKGIISTEDE